MKCPSCGKDMLKSNSHVFCPHCGYLDDGKQIHGYEEHQASDLENKYMVMKNIKLVI